MPATLNIVFDDDGDIRGKVREQHTISAPVVRIERKNLAGTSSNTITWPTGANVCIIIPPTYKDEDGRANYGTLKMTGLTGGDVGQALSPFGPTIVTKGADNGFILTRASGADVFYKFVWF